MGQCEPVLGFKIYTGYAALVMTKITILLNGWCPCLCSTMLAERVLPSGSLPS